MNMQKSLDRIRELTGEIYDLKAAVALLEWDQEVYMPCNAAEGRARQMATLASLLHEKEISAEYAGLIESLNPESFPEDSAERHLVLKLQKNLARNRRISASLAGRLAGQAAKTQSAWMEAKASADFSRVEKDLKELIDLKKEYASLFPEAACPYDALLDDYEEGMTSASLDRIFEPVRRELPDILKEILARPQPDDSFVKENIYSGEDQMKFCRDVVSAMGYDWSCGRIDFTEHPFTTNFGLYDVRITTKILEKVPLSCIFTCIHECGHALYEQNICKDFDRTPLADGTSLGFHESQSRLWENLVGRSAEFWHAFYPVLKKYFPKQLEGISEKAFLRAVNNVNPGGMIRTESDEVSYNLHILLRYDLERALFNEGLSVRDLPGCWNEKMKEYLGVRPANDSEGILQDVHWFCGLFGYFPTYALGNFIGAAMMEKIDRDHPEFRQEISRGNLAPLKNYLSEKLYCLGAMYSPAETWRRICGDEALSSRSFLCYLKQKYLAD